MKKQETHTQGNGKMLNSKNTILIKRSANAQNNAWKIIEANDSIKTRSKINTSE